MESQELTDKEMEYGKMAMEIVFFLIFLLEFKYFLVWLFH